MRKLFAFVLMALLVGVGIVVVIQTDPGYVLVSYGNYTLESSLWVGLLLLLLLVMLVFLLLRLAYRIVGGQRTLFSWLGARKVRNSQRLSSRGLISFTEGNWLDARRQLVRGAQHNEAPLANYLLAARASAQLQETDKVKEYLLAAGKAEPGAAMAVEIAQAEMHLQAGEYQQAIAALEHAMRNVNRHPHVLVLLREAYAGIQDWDKLLELLPQLQKHKLIGVDEVQQVEREIHYNCLNRAHTDREQLQAVWQKLPRSLQHDAGMVELYVRNLLAAGDHDTAQSILERALKHEWDTNLVRQYGYVQSDDVQRQLGRAESWLSAHPEDAQLLLCLGRVSARCKLWGKARDYFESSYRLEHSAEICAELGRLLSELGESTVAAAYFREGLLLRENALPDLPMPDKIVPDSRLLASS
ncbi:MAG: heme biosynthesis HemY N-terminal domain-containing protein [Halioglobus sp.]